MKIFAFKYYFYKPLEQSSWGLLMLIRKQQSLHTEINHSKWETASGLPIFLNREGVERKISILMDLKMLIDT